jgi:hypothetical protein
MSKIDDLLKDLDFTYHKGKNPKMFIYKGTLYENKKGKWKPEIPEELKEVFASVFKPRRKY